MTVNKPFFTDLSDNPHGIRAVFQERPNKYMMLLSFAQEILREDSYLSSTDREVIAAYTSKLNNCQYCTESHVAFAVSLDTPQDDLSILDTLDIENHRLSPILKYVKKLTLDPSSISQEDKDSVISAGFSEDELKDAIAVCAAFNLFNRIVEGYGVQPQKSYEMVAAMIKKHGYDRRYTD
jgi:uncharacterized peroxidase-related enzyme